LTAYAGRFSAWAAGAGGAEIAVAIDASVAEELRVPEPRDPAEHLLLLGNPKPGLEADQVPHLPGAVLSPELDHGMGLPAGARIGQADRLHGTEA
jgi:hypothetical protein